MAGKQIKYIQSTQGIDMETVCCICHKIKSPEGWVHQTELQYTNLSHGYCPECYLKMMRKLQIANYLTSSGQHNKSFDIN